MLSCSSLGRLIVAMACLCLAGCASAPRDQAAATARPARESIRDFAIDGRISVTRATERGQASIVWQHIAGARDEIDVYSPVGAQMAKLVSSPEGAQLDSAGRAPIFASSVEDLSERIFGSPLPLRGMPDWVLGRATGQPVSAERDSAGRFVYLAEAGWIVRFLEYESSDAAALPRAMDFERGDLRVRLRIDDWRIVR